MSGLLQPIGGAVARVLFVLIVAFTICGCGKKNAPAPPPDEPNTYPRQYPSE